jgi:hypothetical protein
MRGLLGCCLALAVAGCNDPVRNSAIEALGGEAPGVPPGPLHRPGQPCLVCHGGEGPAESEFTLAGTVYQKATGTKPLHDARIRFIDSAGSEYVVVSNCGGNFWASAANFRPLWPVWTKVEYEAESVEMTSAIYREGSCGACHRDTATPSSAAHVYLADDTSAFSEEPCR